MVWGKGASDKRTLRPQTKRRVDKSVMQRLESEGYGNATLGLSSGLQAAVALPVGEDRAVWVGTHSIDFFQEIGMLYDMIEPYCTKKSCPVMAAGTFEYLWSDGTSAPSKVSAPVYVEKLMDWIDSKTQNEQGYPADENDVKVVYKKLFRVIAHMFHNHFNQFLQLEAESHLNLLFKHFMLFVLEFDLIEARELEPLNPFIDTLLPGRRPGSMPATVQEEEK